MKQYTPHDILFDCALLYGGADQRYVIDDLDMLLNAAKQVRTLPAEVVQRLQELQGWLASQTVPLTGNALDHFKAEIGEVLWKVWSIKRQMKIHLDGEGWAYLRSRLSSE